MLQWQTGFVGKGFRGEIMRVSATPSVDFRPQKVWFSDPIAIRKIIINGKDITYANPYGDGGDGGRYVMFWPDCKKNEPITFEIEFRYAGPWHATMIGIGVK